MFCKCKLSWKLPQRRLAFWPSWVRASFFSQIPQWLQLVLLLLGYKLRVAIIMTHLHESAIHLLRRFKNVVEALFENIGIHCACTCHNSCKHMHCFSGKQEHPLAPHTGEWIELFVILLWKVTIAWQLHGYTIYGIIFSDKNHFPESWIWIAEISFACVKMHING